MKVLYQKILNKKWDLKQNTIWYMAGSLSSSATSVLLMMFVTRVLGVNEAGVFAIAYSIAQLMLTIGWYGTRGFQVSDVREEFEFLDYLILKAGLSVVMIIGGGIYSVILGNTGYKLWITFLYCILMVVEVFADLFSSRFQQIDKLYISGMSYVMRNLGYCAVFGVCLLVFEELSIAFWGAIIYSIVELALFDMPLIKETSKTRRKVKLIRIYKLIRTCFPLFISSFVTTFIVNIPKNAIEVSFSQEVQAYYNIIFMPSSLVNMFCMFIFVPLYTKIARTWYSGSAKEFKSIIINLVLIVFGLTVIALVGCWLLGIPVLELVYNVNLEGYKTPFLVLIAAGCLNSLNTVLAYIFTVMRKQKFILLIYIVSLGCSQLLINPLISMYRVIGATLDYFIGISVISILFFGIFVIKFTKWKEEIEKM